MMSDGEDNLFLDEQPASFNNKSSGSNNPRGVNQHKGCPSIDDPQLQHLIRKYDRDGVSNLVELSRLLLAEHDIKISATSVKRCRHKIGLMGSGTVTKKMDDVAKRQLVLDQMAKDPMRRKGPRVVWKAISKETGINLTRDYVEAEMRLQDPDGFKLRATNPKKPQSHAPILGPHFEWSGDGHDKLAAIGFPIWGIRDVWSGKWLGLWVVPSNRLKVTIAYLYLSLIEELGGMPIQATTDCGSENTQVYAFASDLREAFTDPSVSEMSAHRFLESIHNTTIERGWLRSRLLWGDNVKIFWDRGTEVYGYDSNGPEQYELVQWLWPKLIQQELDKLKHYFNAHKTRKDRKKDRPSGCTPNIAMELCQEYGGQNCLRSVDRESIRGLMEELGGEDLLCFVSFEYVERAQAVFDTLETELTLENVWHVFQAMLPLIQSCSG